MIQRKTGGRLSTVRSLKIKQTPIFISNFNQLKRDHRNLELLKKVVGHLTNKDMEILARVYKDHALKGHLIHYRELHITSDWLLICKILNKELILILTRTGSHDELL
ncbi:type II toxin-antitoxin system YafQ family toxin [Candidatus Enterococcus huntleyi]|uniref:type II toxin-antitoxin system YafQ family toxin n=1 Tax=Candidatus Enterococcus huntleyi TaxID=1857217 RepID=UPI00137A5F5D|nr:type II toxin-antitoxin system YafQ family toxin [Enterococcus sp. JM4C]